MISKKAMVKQFLYYQIGSETWKDGSSYKGNYVNGKKEGYGTYCWADGSKYEGEWFENKLNGSVNDNS